ncbi:MAG: recombination regulator RecX [Clostridiales bacterium]|nr:recombination regulator RecX [Clostridiales bacterium]
MKILKYHPKKQTADLEWNGEIVSVSDEAAINMRIDIFKEIPDELIPELIERSEEVLCRQYLYSQLDKYFKPKYGYYKKLLEKGYRKDVAKKVVNDAEEKGFIDDRYFAERFVEQNAAKKGSYKLKQELRTKGISADIIDSVLENLPSQTEDLLVLAKKLVKNKENTPEERAKLYRKLASRGFSYDDINSVVKKIFSDEDEY